MLRLQSNVLADRLSGRESRLHRLVYREQRVFRERTELRGKPWGTRAFAFYGLNGHGLTLLSRLVTLCLTKGASRGSLSFPNPVESCGRAARAPTAPLSGSP
jgi:hypothetical protein